MERYYWYDYGTASISDLVWLFAITFICIAIYITVDFIIPELIIRKSKNVQRNPEWLKSKLNYYYGFEDMDIILAERKLGKKPYFRYNDMNKKYELWINSSETTPKAVDIIRDALSRKLHSKYQLSYSDKSAEWLSIVLCLLDGNDISVIKDKKK